MSLTPANLTTKYHAYRWMFDCCRVPGLDGKDFSVTAAKEGDTGDTGFVVVIRKGRFWKVDASVGNQLLSSAELERCEFVLSICTVIYGPIQANSTYIR